MGQPTSKVSGSRNLSQRERQQACTTGNEMNLRLPLCRQTCVSYCAGRLGFLHNFSLAIPPVRAAKHQQAALQPGYLLCTLSNTPESCI
jgi:hypothetical protein